MAPRRWGGDARPLSLAALAHVVIFAGVFRELYTLIYSGTGRFYHYASQLAAGKLPYRDYPLEYPPFALAFFGLPRLFASNFAAYQLGYYAEVAAADLAILALIWYACRRAALSPWPPIVAYTGIVLAIGPVMLHQYDVFPALLTVAAIVAYADGRRSLSAVALALGVMTKVYPLLLVPLFVLLEWRQGRLRDVWRSIAAFAATCVLVVTPWLVAAPRSLLALYAYHANRGVQVESSYASIVFIARAFGVAPARTELGAGSFNLAGPFPDRLAHLSTFVMAAALAAAYLWIARRLRRAPRPETDPPLVNLAATCAALVLLAAIETSKVLSPQYLIWVGPLLPLAARRRAAICGTFILAGMVTYYVYPSHYAALLAGDAMTVTMLTFRNALLLALIALVGDAVAA